MMKITIVFSLMFITALYSVSARPSGILFGQTQQNVEPGQVAQTPNLSGQLIPFNGAYLFVPDQQQIQITPDAFTLNRPSPLPIGGNQQQTGNQPPANDQASNIQQQEGNQQQTDIQPQAGIQSPVNEPASIDQDGAIPTSENVPAPEGEQPNQGTTIQIPSDGPQIVIPPPEIASGEADKPIGPVALEQPLSQK